MRNHALAHSFAQKWKLKAANEREKRRIKYEIMVCAFFVARFTFTIQRQLMWGGRENQPLIVTMEIVFFRSFFSSATEHYSHPPLLINSDDL